MDFTVFTSLISPIIVVACLIVGYVLKNICPNEQVNRYIPLIVCVIGIICNVWALQSFTFSTVVAGAASGLASTGTYETFKNLIEKK